MSTASCALQHAANLSYTPAKVVSLSIDNQATVSTISRPGCSYLAPSFTTSVTPRSRCPTQAV